MAARMLHDTSDPKTDCGCGPKTPEDRSCEALTYSDCPQTFKPIRKGSVRRLSFDFGKSACGNCCDLMYERIRLVETTKSNPANCPETEGFLNFSQEFMDPYTGHYYFTLDAKDYRLRVGERFKVRVWARTPQAEENYIEAYISVGH